MESGERIHSAFRHRPVDRTPLFEYVLISDEITRHVLKRPYSQLHWDAFVREKGWKETVQQLAVDVLDIAAFFGHDMLYQVPVPMPASSQARNKTSDKSGSSDDPVEKIRNRNEEKKNNSRGIPAEPFLIYSSLKEEMGKRGTVLPILVPAYGHGVWTDVDLMQTMLLAPEVAHEHFTLATKNAESVIKKYIELEIEMIGIGGDFAGNKPLISPESYRTFIAPELRKLSNVVHSSGSYAVNASDGNLWSVIDDFLVGTGVDGYLEIDLHAGMELKRLKNAYASRTTFLGNMDCGNTLSFGSPEQIRKAAIQCIEDGTGNGGHVFTASNAITDSVPTENYFA
ncbi:MAG: uroporphyrinogen decarboxylase family protein, partial [Victivallales bacterium]